MEEIEDAVVDVAMTGSQLVDAVTQDVCVRAAKFVAKCSETLNASRTCDEYTTVGIVPHYRSGATMAQHSPEMANMPGA